MACQEPATAVKGGATAAGVQVLERAAAILRALQVQDGQSLARLAAAVSLPRSTVQRICGALEREGLVEAGPDGAGLRLGRGLAAFATAGAGPLHVRRAAPGLARLAARLGEAVDLAVLEGAQVRVLHQVPGSGRLRADAVAGSTLPAWCSATGKALLATLPDAAVATLLPAALPTRTPTTIGGRDALLRELAGVRARGCAVDREEHTPGIAGVARVVVAPDGWTAAVTVPVPASRYAGRERALEDALRIACAEIEDDLRRPLPGGR